MAGASRRVRGSIGAADICETAVKPVAQFFWVEFLVDAAAAGNHHARGGHPRKPRDTDEFPRHPHRCVAYGW